MADNVQYVLDKMAVTFSMLKEADIFNSKEISSIIQKRTNFEYMMQRRVLEAGDVRAYLSYEIKLNELRGNCLPSTGSCQVFVFCFTLNCILRRSTKS